MGLVGLWDPMVCGALSSANESCYLIVRASVCGVALLAAYGWEVLGRALEGRPPAGTSWPGDLRRDSCHLTPALVPFLSAGVDLSNIVKSAPRASLDGLQEPTHDVLQVGASVSARRCGGTIGGGGVGWGWGVSAPCSIWQKSVSECRWSVHFVTNGSLQPCVPGSCEGSPACGGSRATWRILRQTSTYLIPLPKCWGHGHTDIKGPGPALCGFWGFEQVCALTQPMHTTPTQPPKPRP